MYFLCLGLFLCSCVGNRSQPKVGAEIKSEFPLDTTVHFEYSRHCAYGYSISWPKGFKEQIDTIGQVDSLVLLSPKNDAILKYFVEGEVKRNDTTRNFLFDYFQKIEKGKHSLVIGSKSVQSSVLYNNNKHANYRGHFVIIGEVEQREFVWKTVLSEVPISGDLTYKSMFFSYPKEQNKYYQPIGLYLAKEFGDYMSSQPN